MELVPTPIIDESSDDADTDVPSTDAEHQRRRDIIEAEDGHATPVQGRRKRRREWVWRPMEDDVLALHDLKSPSAGGGTPLSAKSPAMSVIEKSDFGMGRFEGASRPST